MDEARRSQWDSRHRLRHQLPAPSRALRENAHLLPLRGRALDLACGLGGDALYLAARGLQVWAWDYSTVAIERLRRRAARLALALVAEVRDVVTCPPEGATFDVVNVSHFLHRPLLPALVAALRPGGLLCYQTFTQRSPREPQCGPRSPEYRLRENELLRLLVPPLRLRAYREEDLTGDPLLGWRGMALLVGQNSAAPAAGSAGNGIDPESGGHAGAGP